MFEEILYDSCFMKLGIDCHHIEDQLGIKRYTLALLHEWENLGYLKGENEVICYFKKQLPEFSDLPKAVKIVYTNTRSNVLFTQFRLPYEAMRDRVDVLFSPSYILPLFYWRKSVVTIHDIIYAARPKEFDWHSRFDKLYTPNASRLGALKARFILVPSEFTKKEIKKHWRINPSKIFVIPLAGDIDTTQHQALAPKGDFVLFVGSIFNRRHIIQTIHAFYSLTKTQSTLRFIIIGKDATRPPQHIDELIKKANYNLKRQAIIRKDGIGNSELFSLYTRARALVWLSDYEGFGLPVLEAMKCGLPVLTTRKGSLKEVAGDAALYVEDPFDIKEISKKLLRILTDTELRRKLKAKGIKQAQQFSWTKTAKETWNILKLAQR